MQDGAENAIFICENGKTYGSFTFNKQAYQLYALQNSTSILMEIDQTIPDKCASFGTIGKQSNSTIPVPEATYSNQRRAACQEPMRVLVLYTAQGAAAVPDINQVATLSIEQYNTALDNSAIGGTLNNRLQLAGVVPFYSFTESADPNGDQANLRNNANAQALRNQYKADIVVLLIKLYDNGTRGTVGQNTNYPDGFNIPAQNSTAYALVSASYSSRQNYFTFAHEVGHLLGGRHNTDTNSNPSYTHGHVIEFKRDPLQTIMGTESIDRLLNYSNPNVSVWGLVQTTPFNAYGDQPTGSVNLANVAKRIGEVSPTVVEFRESANSLFGTVSGPNYISQSGTNTWEFVYGCKTISSTQWRISNDGFNYGAVVGSSETYTQYVNSSNNGLMLLWCHATASDGSVFDARAYVTVGVCAGCREANEDASLSEVSLYPNPAVNELTVSFILPKEATTVIDLIDAYGRTTKTVHLGKLEVGYQEKTLGVSDLNHGIYLCRIHTDDQLVATQKIIITH